MLLKMTHVQIIGARARLDATIAALHRLGVLHIEEASAAGALKSLALDEAGLRLQEDLSFLAARLDALLHLLPDAAPGLAAGWQAPATAGALAEQVRAGLDRIAPPIQELAQRRDELQAEATALPRYAATLRKLAPLALELRPLQGFETAALLIDRRHSDTLDLIRVEVERITRARSEVIAQEVDEHTIAALLIYPRPLADEVQAVLGQENITQVRLPRELAGHTFRDALVALEQRQGAIRAELAQVDAELARCAAECQARLLAWRRAIASRAQELAARARFSATAYAFVVEGWVPRRELGRLRAALEREVGAQVIVSELPHGPDDEARAPVAFQNPAPLRPFEMLVRMMAVPRPGAFDPTPVLAVFLPLFFGIILGDVAYGALLLLLALYLRRRFAARETLRNLAQILVYGAIWAIVFGLLYGEFLGTLGPAVGLRPLWVARDGGESIGALFAFSIGLGVFQVTLGLLLGVWEAWRERQRSEMLKKLGVLIVLSAIFGMVGATMRWLPATLFTPTVVALLIGLTLLIIPAGPLGLLLGPLDLLETVGNMLSYLRLAAIGLSSVYLAMVANQMAGLVGNVLVGVILAALLHALNFALGVLSPTIQALRLHYVEFFRQFYQGGGVEYRPFRID